MFQGETDQTPWACWINIDADQNNGNHLSYWHRCGSRVGQAATGEYFIRHEGHPTVNQTGWLITPRLFLQPDRDYTTLSFKEMTGGSGFEATLSVMVSTNSDPNNTNAYTQVWSSNSPNLTWQTRSIDLSAYQGQAGCRQQSKNKEDQFFHGIVFLRYNVTISRYKVPTIPIKKQLPKTRIFQCGFRVVASTSFPITCSAVPRWLRRWHCAFCGTHW